MLLKNAFIALFSFSILYAETLKECKNETDKISGCMQTYYDNGAVFKVPYKNNEVVGTIKAYYPNGNVALEIPYKNGTTEGIEKQYFENGNLESETPYKNDKREGAQKIYNENGNLMAEIPYLNNLFHGDTRFYTEDGKLLALVKGENGKITSGKCSNNKAPTNKDLEEIGRFYNAGRAINYLQRICLKESDSK